MCYLILEIMEVDVYESYDNYNWREI